MSTAVPPLESASPNISAAADRANPGVVARARSPAPAIPRLGRATSNGSPAPPALLPQEDREPTRAADTADWTPSWAPLVLRWRPALVIAWALMHLLAFNGQWRIGADSATFRSVARSLAAGEGYAILGAPQTQVYPGLPLLLAGLERLFGPVAWPAVLVMFAVSAAILWLTYKLIRRIAPGWVATVVTAGVGFNAVFVQHGHELMTDLPFLLGVMMALWGWETLSDPGRWRRLRSGIILALGLGLAAGMRPTFWVLALAFALVCVGGLAVALFPRFAPRAWTSGADRARSWRFYAACLTAVVVVGFAFAALDPRTRSLDLLAGGYEAEVAQRVMSLDDRLRETPAKLWEMLEDHLEALFFAERIEGLNILLAVTLLAGVVLVFRRRPLWGLLVGLLLLTLYFASTSERYYLMVLPILWLGWIMVSAAIAQRLFRQPRSQAMFAAVLIGAVWLCNVGHDIKLIVEQRSLPFVQGYKDGDYEPVVAMAGLIGRVTEPGDVIIGPHAPEMTYLSGRLVLGRRELFTGTEPTSRAKAEVVKGSGADWAVFPTTIYERKDLPLYRLGRAGIFVPSNRDDSTVFSAGTFKGTEWYLTRDWAIDETMIPVEEPPTAP